MFLKLVLFKKYHNGYIRIISVKKYTIKNLYKFFYTRSNSIFYPLLVDENDNYRYDIDEIF